MEIRSKLENIIDNKAVFVNKNGKRLNEDNIQSIFRNYSGGKISPHMMRHLYATVLYQESGHDAVFVQEQLRHSDVNTTLGTYATGDSRSYKVLEKMWFGGKMYDITGGRESGLLNLKSDSSFYYIFFGTKDDGDGRKIGVLSKCVERFLWKNGGR